MGVRFCIDAVNGIPFGTEPVKIPRGGMITITGWALDPQTIGPVPVYARAGADMSATSATVVVRDDVARHFGSEALRHCGFSVKFENTLRLGVHDITLGTDMRGQFVPATTVRIVSSEPPTSRERSSPRILVIGWTAAEGAPTAALLSAYFGTQGPSLEGLAAIAQRRFDETAAARLRDRAFVLPLGLDPSEAVMQIFVAHGIVPIIAWPNLADAIVAFDVALCSQDRAAGAACAANPERYRSLPDQRRYEFLIRYVVPSRVNWYLGWLRHGSIIARADASTAGPAAYLYDLLAQIGEVGDQSKYGAALEAMTMLPTMQSSPNTLSAQNQKALESLLHEHVDDLSELVAELPWHRTLLDSVYAI